MIPLRDLEPRYDVKGGSPKTPIPIPVKNIEGYIETKGDNEGVWRVIACSAITALVGMTVAWWTALQSKGMTQAEKEFLSLQQTTQDEKIGSLMGYKDRIFDRLNMIESRHVAYDNSITEISGKIKLFGDYIDEQRKAKR